MHCNLQNENMCCGPGLSMAPAARMETCEDHLLHSASNICVHGADLTL